MDETTNRTIDVLEIWSGVGSVTAAARCKGLVVQCIDLISGEPHCDVLSREGFLHAVSLVLQVVPGGLVWMAPVCSSFVWLSASISQRSKENDFRGNQTVKSVIDGNLGADIAAFLFALAWSRGVHAAIENPPGSTVWKYPAVRALTDHLPRLAAAVVRRCVFDDAEYGHRYGKAYRILASNSWVTSPALTQGCSCPGRVHCSMVRRDDQGKVWGLQSRLTESQAYPTKMGHAIIAAWSVARTAPPTSTSSGSRDQSDASSGVLVRPSPRVARWVPASDSDDDSESERGSGVQVLPSSGPVAAKRSRLAVSTSSDEDAPHTSSKAWMTAASDSDGTA
jgi:hypothetical protein